jgi:hypothetical protein
MTDDNGPALAETRAKHTPGPWTCKDVVGAGLQIWASVNLGKTMYSEGLQPIYRIGIKPQLVVGDDGIAAAQMCYEDWRQFPSVNFTEMQKANARLIAASPELLGMVKSLLMCVSAHGLEPFCNATATAARELIAKAEGTI